MRTLIGCIFLISSAFGITQQDAEVAVQNAHKLFGEKKWEDALSQYQTALTYNSSAQIFYNVGQCYSALNKPGFALAYFLKAENIKPKWKQLKDTLKQFYEQNTNFIPVEKHLHEKLFSILSPVTWQWLCALSFWVSIIGFVYFFCIRKNKSILYVGSFAGCLFCTTWLLIMIQNTSNQRGILPEVTTARFAPGDNSPVRYNWDAGTRCTIKTERSDYYFVNTSFDEDGWIKKQDFIAL